MDTEVIKISIDKDEKIYGLLRRMLEIKETEKKEVECQLEDRVLTTKECNNIQDMILKNNTAIFDEFEKDKNILIQTPEMQEVIEKFQNRGKKYDGSEVNPEEIAHEISVQTKEFENKLSQLETLNFSSPMEVYNWLNTIIKYINNHDLTLPTGLDKMDYGNITNYIVKKLEEKGYTSEKNDVNTLEDYYRRLLSYQISDLDKYGFFAYDYADNEEVRKNLTTDSLEEIEKEIVKVKTNISGLVNYQNGTIDNNKNITVDYETRKKDINDKIKELEQQEVVESDPVKEFSQANEDLRKIAYQPGRYLSENASKAMQAYVIATGLPSTDKIIKALESANSLLEIEEIKQPLINAIIKLDKRYLTNKDEEDIQLMNETLNRLGIKIPENEKEVKINKLKEELESLEQEKQTRIKNTSKRKEILTKKLDELTKKQENISKQKEESNQQEEIINKEEPINQDNLNVQEEQPKEENLNKSEETPKEETKEIVSDSTEKDNNIKQEETKVNEDFISKLEQIANEGRISTDESRLSPEYDWLNLANAQNIGKVNPEIENQEEDKKTIVEQVNNNEPVTTEIVNDNELNITEQPEIEDIKPVKETFSVPRAIKSVKQAPINLINKIKSSSFIEKIKTGIEWIKKTKEASVVLSLLLISSAIGIGAASHKDNDNTNTNIVSSIVSEYEEQEQNVETPEITVDTENNTNDNLTSAPQQEQIQEETIIEKTEDQIFEEELQNVVNDILSQNTQVYRSANNAMEGVEGITPTSNQIDSSWQNAAPGAYYDENIMPITEEQAITNVNEGETVVARMDNNGSPIGYVPINQQEETGITR